MSSKKAPAAAELITISPLFQQMTDRLEIIEAKMRMNDNFFDEVLCNEAGELREDIKSAATPILEALIRTRLLDVTFDNTKYLKKKYKYVEFDIVNVYENGNLVLECDSESSGEGHALRDDGHPNLGNCDLQEYALEVHRLARGPKGPFGTWLQNNKASVEAKFEEYQKLNEESNVRYAAMRRSRLEKQSKGEELATASMTGDNCGNCAGCDLKKLLDDHFVTREDFSIFAEKVCEGIPSEATFEAIIKPFLEKYEFYRKEDQSRLMHAIVHVFGACNHENHDEETAIH